MITESSLETICDNLVDIKHLENENIKRLEEDVCEYKSILEIIGYYHSNKEIKEKLEKKIIILRIYIIKYYDNLLRTKYVYHLKLLITDIDKTFAYKKGKDKYYTIRNTLIYFFKKELYNSFINNDHTIIEKNINNIIKYDATYDIYHNTISYMMKHCESFKKMMIDNYIDLVWI